jgi:HEAT repeat protein
MIQEGHAVQLARMMLRENRLFPAFLKLLVHPEWSVRMGAMVVMEEIAEGNRDLAGDAAEFLWRGLENADPTVKGDIVYLLGEVGKPEMARGLRDALAVSGEGKAEFREVLEEAIMKLEGA